MFRHIATIGTISEGTLRTEDLLDAFASELEYLNKGDNGQNKEEIAALIADYENGNDESELVDEMQDALGVFAPPYCYFGTHDGDGADFGFWPCMESINDLPRVEDSDEAKALGTDCCFVNDHGNVTIFGGDGSIVIDFV